MTNPDTHDPLGIHDNSTEYEQCKLCHPTSDGREVDDLRRALEIAQIERNCARVAEQTAIDMLVAIYRLLPPLPLEKDGGRYEYKDPNAMETLNMLRDKIYAIKNNPAIALPTAAGADKADGWLPIESAPKDGEEIIVFHTLLAGETKGKQYVCAAYWDDERQMWSGLPPYEHKVTHWKPLPIPPTKA